MKKRMLLAMALIMVLGSVKAMAEENDEIYNEIQRGKIEAVMADQSEADSVCLECEEINAQGKWDAAELDMNLINIEAQIKELKKMKMELKGIENTAGLVKAIDKTIAAASKAGKEIKASSDLKKSRQLVSELSNEICNLNMANPLNAIPGLKVHEELGCNKN